MVCASGTALLTMEECQAFNGPGAGTWQGDLSGSAGHVAVHPRGCWVWNGVNRHWIQPDGVIKTEALSTPICYGAPVRPSPVVYVRSSNMVCPTGDDVQTMEECQAFNGPGAGTWQGDLSGSVGHLAVHPRGCWVWNNRNRHWIQPDGVIKREALSKPICYGTPARPGPVVTRSTSPVVMSSSKLSCTSATALQTMEECQAFNGPGAGTWQGDLSGSAGHVAVHPRGCWVWNDQNRHWIQPDGVTKTEALSKAICYGTSVSPIGRRLLSKQDN